ncbi:hypothetical protein F5I97DRAFT_1805814 [Phlebopus sp. FC_14]|nr:hypothetical protein F5I97DRAFT_1805814 [Phlebopus sp. FC_14]
MECVPKLKKARTKSTSRKTTQNVSPAVADEVLIDSEPADTITTKNARYAEPSSLAVHSGIELGQEKPMDGLVDREVEGALNTDLAELSLGQRLAAVAGVTANAASESDSDGGARPYSMSRRKEASNVVPTHSLTRTLIQALHSSDSRLLETCLAHSNPQLIRNTVRRLPPQLAVPLLLACVERLGRGARAANMKGGGGGASSQRGMVLIAWVKTTLAVHSGHLMTMPDLVARLSSLHATLTSRLALQESLLSLNGKLDMVLSQIEMRSSTAPAIVSSRKDISTRSNGIRQPTHYVEGESENEEEQINVEAPVESGDEEGSVEDIELGGDSEDDSEDDGNGEEEDEERSDGSDPAIDDFIDDEAEEFDEEEDDSE